jgi:bile acid:Na+ symporter, BASS family
VDADAVDVVLQACVVLFMVGSLGGAGLEVAPRAVLAPLRDGRFVRLTLAGSWLLSPAVAYLLVGVVPLDRPYATGLVLLALAPCAPFAPAMVRTARGDPAYAAAFMILSAVTTAAVMPVALPLLVPGLSADPWAVARPLLLFVLGPLLAGTAVRGLRPQAADRLAPPTAAVTRGAALALMLFIVFAHGRGVMDAIGSYAIATQVLFVVLVTIAADRLGAGLPDAQRSVLTIGLCTRNLGAALAPLAAIDRDPRAVVMIAIAIPVTLAASAFAARRLARRIRIGGPRAAVRPSAEAPSMHARR